jgi:hypothetical protein
MRIQEFTREIVFGNPAPSGVAFTAEFKWGIGFSSQALAGQRKAP